MPAPTVEPKFFRSAAAFRKWLEKHHDSETELWLGLYNKASGKGGLTYPEAVDEALCFGWIDGIVRRHDDVSHVQRFTPRKPKSIWSNVNVAKVEGLIRDGRMMPAGLAAYERRDPARTGVYAFEREDVAFTPELERSFKRAKAAWEWFGAQSPYYRRVATHYVVSAKREETRQRRLASLIECSARGERIPQFVSTPKPRKT